MLSLDNISYTNYEILCQIQLIVKNLNNLEKEYNNVNKISEIIYIYLYKNLKLHDVFLANLLLDGEPFDRKGCTGYINYLKIYLQNLNDYKKVKKINDFIKYLSYNQKLLNIKKIALTY